MVEEALIQDGLVELQITHLEDNGEVPLEVEEEDLEEDGEEETSQIFQANHPTISNSNNKNHYNNNFKKYLGRSNQNKLQISYKNLISYLHSLKICIHK